MGKLYRGISKTKYERDKCRIVAHRVEAFSKTTKLDEEMSLDEGFTLDSSAENAVVMHQKDSSKFPTSGISTTPIFERAKYYALGHCDEGYVFEIDEGILSSLGIRAHRVSEFTSMPKIPEDEEVIIELGLEIHLPMECITKIDKCFK